MERAAKSLAKLRLSGKISEDELARAAWPAVVGKTITAHTSAVALVRTKLVIEVEDAIWQKQLFHLRHQILSRIKSFIGEDLITDLEFRIARERRLPQTATTLAPSNDEADGIRDTVMRIVYKQARKKASA